MLFNKLDTAKMHGLDTSNVSCRDVTSRVKWNLGLTLRVTGGVGSDLRILGGWHHGSRNVLPTEQRAERRRSQTVSRHRGDQRAGDSEGKDGNHPVD